MIFFHFLRAACVGAFFLQFHTSIILQPCKQQAKPPLSTAENADDYLGYYLLLLQQDQAELGPAFCTQSCVSRNGLALYRCTVSIKERGGDGSAPQPVLPMVMP